MTVKELASIGGKARAKKLSPERRKEIAKNAGLAPRKSKTCKQAQTVPIVRFG